VPALAACARRPGIEDAHRAHWMRIACWRSFCPACCMLALRRPMHLTRAFAPWRDWLCVRVT
jgi:hypothetical protein